MSFSPSGLEHSSRLKLALWLPNKEHCFPPPAHLTPGERKKKTHWSPPAFTAPSSLPPPRSVPSPTGQRRAEPERGRLAALAPELPGRWGGMPGPQPKAETRSTSTFRGCGLNREWQDQRTTDNKIRSRINPKAFILQIKSR